MLGAAQLLGDRGARLLIGVPDRHLAVGAAVFVLTWLHQAQRDVLAVPPRDDPRNPETGVFSG